MTTYTHTDLVRLEQILAGHADKAAPRPALGEPHVPGTVTAASMLRDLAVRGYIAWWLTRQSCSTATVEHDTWWGLHLLTATQRWQTARFLQALRSGTRPGALDELTATMYSTGADQIGVDLERMAAAAGVRMDKLTRRAAAEVRQGQAAAPRHPDIPAEALPQLADAHAHADGMLTEMLLQLDADGAVDLPAPERMFIAAQRLGHLEDLPWSATVTVTAAAIARLLDTGERP